MRFGDTGKRTSASGHRPCPTTFGSRWTRLPAGVVGEQYNFVLTASGGTLPYSWFVTSGSLPPGLTLENGGFLTGTPTTASSYPFTIQVTDGSASPQVASQGFTIMVSATAVLRIETPTLPVAHIDQPYEHPLEASGGSGSYSWSLAGGSLPDGLSLLGDGTLQGTPTALAVANFTVQVQDGSSTALKSYQLKVLGAGGEDWTVLGKTSPVVHQIVVDPNDPNHLIASTRNIDAVFDTANAGDSWRATSINNNLNDAAKRLGINPITSQSWVLREMHNPHPPGQSGPTEAVYRFDDAISQWIPYVECPLGEGAIFDTLGFGVAGDTLLATIFHHGSCGGLPIIGGIEGGNRLYQFTQPSGPWSFVGDLCGIGDYDTFNATSSFSSSSADPSILYLLRGAPAPVFTNHPCISDDGGATWREIKNGSTGWLDIQASQADALDVVKAGSAYVERSTDGGRNWTRHDLPVSAVACCLRRAATQPALLLFGTDQGLFRSTNNGQTWTSLPIKGRTPGITSLAIDPHDADRFFVGTVEGVYHSSDGGSTWALKNDGLVRRILSDVCGRAYLSRVTCCSAPRRAPTSRGRPVMRGPSLPKAWAAPWSTSSPSLPSIRTASMPPPAIPSSDPTTTE